MSDDYALTSVVVVGLSECCTDVLSRFAVDRELEEQSL